MVETKRHAASCSRADEDPPLLVEAKKKTAAVISMHQDGLSYRTDEIRQETD